MPPIMAGAAFRQSALLEAPASLFSPQPPPDKGTPKKDREPEVNGPRTLLRVAAPMILFASRPPMWELACDAVLLKFE
jgi:hypothetical protein